MYGNEKSVGQAIREHRLNREDIWVTTKLWPSDFANPKKAINKSLKLLDIGYIDLYLIHWPTPVEIPGLEKSLWRKMESFKNSGLCRSIGVSNYQAIRLKKILKIAEIPPSVNQIRFSPFHHPEKLYDFLSENNIATIGYAPLNEGNGLDDISLQQIAKKHGKTVTQVMLRWSIQKNVIPIPKSSHQNRAKENIDVFDFKLSEIDMSLIDSISS